MIAIAVAAAVVLGAAAGAIALAGQTQRADAQQKQSAAEQKTPTVSVELKNQQFETVDAGGLNITLDIPVPQATVTGTSSTVAEEFASAVADEFADDINEALSGYTPLTQTTCSEGPIEYLDAGPLCAESGTTAVEQAEVYGDYLTVATRSEFLIGAEGYNFQVHSVTMNLETGETAELSDFLDLSDDADLARATEALESAENWDSCGTTADRYLAKAEAFSPADGGLLLLWAPNKTVSSQCQVDAVTVPWSDDEGEESDAETEEEEEVTEAPKEAEAEPQAADISGTWCPTADSAVQNGCMTIAYPQVTYADGSTALIEGAGLNDGAATRFQYSTVDSAGNPLAPFGITYAAGDAIDIPDYASAADQPDVDRIWNGQTAALYVRSE